MRRGRLLVLGVATIAVTTVANEARAQTYSFSFTGPGVSGSVFLTYGPATDAKYPNAFEVTGISGSFTDTNNGLHIVNAPIGSLVAVTHATPEPGNLLAPNDFSRYAVGSGLPAQNGGFSTYDNLFWPGGSPPTASDYPLHGGFLDIYGLLFGIGNNQYVNFWSNGVTGDATTPNYGASVVNTDHAFDYVAGGVVARATTVPEPSSLALLGTGLIGLVPALRRRIRAA